MVQEKERMIPRERWGERKKRNKIDAREPSIEK
jgi:hypothetical protein